MPLVTGPSSAIEPVQIPDMVGNYARLQQLKQQMQEAPLRQQALQQQVQAGQQNIQQGQLDIQQKQIALRDQQAMNAAMQQWGQPKQGAAPAPQGASATPGESATPAATGMPATQGAAAPSSAMPNYDDLIDLARKNGASFSAIQGLQKTVLDMKDKASTIAKNDAQTGQDNASAMKTKNGMIIDAMSGVMNLPDDQLVPGLLSAAQDLAGKGLLDPQHVQMAQQLAQTGDPAAIRKNLTMQINGMGGFNKLLDDATKKVELDQKQRDLAFGPTGPAADSKYTFLQSRLAQNQPITAGDQAWMKGYEKQKTLVPTARFELSQGAKAAVATPGYTGTTGDDFLATLPAGMQAQVKAMANGDITIPPAGSRNPQAQQLRAAVLTYDPTYTDARYKGKQNFKTSGDAQNIVQLSTAMEHADHAISNSANIGFAPMLGNPKLESPGSAAYMQDAEFLTGEVGKLVKNGVLTVDESSKISSGLMSSRQDVRDAALKETMDLLGGKVGGVFQKYKTATGQDLPVNEFFDAKSQQRLQKYGFVNQAAGQGSTGNSSGAASGNAAPAGYVRIQASDGSLHDLPQSNLGKARQRDPGLKVVNP